MTNEAIVALGRYSESLLTDPRFNELVGAFEDQIAKSIFQTKPEDKAEREHLFATVNGLKEFLGLCQALNLQAKQLTSEPQEQDTLDVIDTDSVHDIFEKD